jgi:hypothetical protein
MLVTYNLYILFYTFFIELLCLTLWCVYSWFAIIPKRIKVAMLMPITKESNEKPLLINVHQYGSDKVTCK